MIKKIIEIKSRSGSSKPTYWNVIDVLRNVVKSIQDLSKRKSLRHI